MSCQSNSKMWATPSGILTGPWRKRNISFHLFIIFNLYFRFCFEYWQSNYLTSRARSFIDQNDSGTWCNLMYLQHWIQLWSEHHFIYSIYHGLEMASLYKSHRHHKTHKPGSQLLHSCSWDRDKGKESGKADLSLPLHSLCSGDVQGPAQPQQPFSAAVKLAEPALIPNAPLLLLKPVWWEQGRAQLCSANSQLADNSLRDHS